MRHNASAPPAQRRALVFLDDVLGVAPTNTLVESSTSSLGRPGYTPIALALAQGTAIEVAWQLDLDGSGILTVVWWRAMIGAPPASASTATLTIVYAEQHGFESEPREVILCDERELWDVAEAERFAWRRVTGVVVNAESASVSPAGGPSREDTSDPPINPDAATSLLVLPHG